MFEINDDAKGGFRRVEILTGPSRRRKWSAECRSEAPMSVSGSLHAFAPSRSITGENEGNRTWRVAASVGIGT